MEQKMTKRDMAELLSRGCNRSMGETQEEAEIRWAGYFRSRPNAELTARLEADAT
jgi:hypothetical protein